MPLVCFMTSLVDHLILWDHPAVCLTQIVHRVVVGFPTVKVFIIQDPKRIIFVEGNYFVAEEKEEWEEKEKKK